MTHKSARQEVQSSASIEKYEDILEDVMQDKDKSVPVCFTC